MTLTAQDERVCNICDRRFLSGIIHLDRGWSGAAICIDCSQERLSLDWDKLKAISNEKRVAAQGKSNA